MVLPLQCLMGFALATLQARAQTYAGHEARVGGWATLLVLGNFSSGWSVWWAGYLDCVHEAQRAVAFCFVLAAVGQLVSGSSLLMVNWKVRKLFEDADGASGSELQPTQLGQPEQMASPREE
mmetsp:Transcript_89991/g.194697  ORF Transcript_89991/g.194697 Transcript_89991/m.194697 type:complete len:122 (-) Transcript_89991:12-377(-)